MHVLNTDEDLPERKILKNKNILISGASIAGPALAFWLSRYGFIPAPERAPTIRPGGYAVDFRGAALSALERMGILGEVKKFETRTGAITIVDKANRKVASLPDGFTSGELEIMRGDPPVFFYQASRQDAEYIFDDTITGLTQSDPGVAVTFSRARAREFDLVVGADGLHSTSPRFLVRSLVLCVTLVIMSQSLPFLIS